MGTNKQSEVIDLVRGTKLRIKYHADHALNPNQKDKLVRGLLLSDQALVAASIAPAPSRRRARRWNRSTGP